jgi:hypothetical protein
MSKAVYLDEDCRVTWKHHDDIEAGVRCVRCARKVKPDAINVSHGGQLDDGSDFNSVKLDPIGKWKIGKDCAKKIGLLDF